MVPSLTSELYTDDGGLKFLGMINGFEKPASDTLENIESNGESSFRINLIAFKSISKLFFLHFKYSSPDFNSCKRLCLISLLWFSFSFSTLRFSTKNEM